MNRHWKSCKVTTDQEQKGENRTLLLLLAGDQEPRVTWTEWLLLFLMLLCFCLFLILILFFCLATMRLLSTWRNSFVLWVPWPGICWYFPFEKGLFYFCFLLCVCMVCACECRSEMLDSMSLPLWELGTEFGSSEEQVMTEPSLQPFDLSCLMTLTVYCTSEPFCCKHLPIVPFLWRLSAFIWFNTIYGHLFRQFLFGHFLSVPCLCTQDLGLLSFIPQELTRCYSATLHFKPLLNLQQILLLLQALSLSLPSYFE